ncbi:unnamed protein product [Adineta steineri]|uniref:Uncharacterized protein n=1 Tax=Adineta steineri TaxID=433720 RepID=A0A813Y6G2_9BILA|nr:unnamed protein product [Adineta steineri]
MKDRNLKKHQTVNQLKASIKEKKKLLTKEKLLFKKKQDKFCKQSRTIELARLESMKEIIQIFDNALKIYSDEFLEERKSYDPKEDLKQ